MAFRNAYQRQTLQSIRDALFSVHPDNPFRSCIAEHWLYDPMDPNECDDAPLIWVMYYDLSATLDGKYETDKGYIHQAEHEQRCKSPWTWDDIAACASTALSKVVPCNHEGIYWYAFTCTPVIVNKGPNDEQPQYDDILETWKMQLRIYFEGAPQHQEMPDCFYSYGKLNGCTGIMDGRSRLLGAPDPRANEESEECSDLTDCTAA